jgi:hypothetical protein
MNEEFAKGVPIQLSALSRVPSTFAGHYDFAAFLVFTIPIAFSLFMSVRSWFTKILLGVEDKERQFELANLCKDQKISVRKLEKMAAQKKASVSESNEKSDELLSASLSDRLIAGLGEEVQKLLGTKVNIDYNGSKGKVSIYFYSDEELTNIIDKLRAGCQN